MHPPLQIKCAAGALSTARELAHSAAQWPSLAARANLAAATDDSHSNLGWDPMRGALLSRPLDRAGDRQLGLSFANAQLLWLHKGELVDALSLSLTDDTGAANWCDRQLVAAGLAPGSEAELPYELGTADYRALVNPSVADAFETLGAWFARAHESLEALIKAFGHLAVSAPAPRCWPHHFDIATLFALDRGDPHIARSVATGLSPGDTYYPEPYLYCNPWPVPESFPPAPPGLRWHREGFTSLVCPVSELQHPGELTARMQSAFSAVHAARTRGGDNN